MTKMAKKKPVSEVQAQESAVLKDFFIQKKGELGLNQEQLAEKLNISQSAVNHYLNGTNSLNPIIAAQFASALNIHIDDFSPRLAEEVRTMSESLRPSISLNHTGNFSQNGSKGSSQFHIGNNDFSNQNNNNYGNGNYYHISNYDDDDCENNDGKISQYDHLLIKPMPVLDIAEAIRYAENNQKIPKSSEKAATFIHHSEYTFAVRMPDDTMANPDFGSKSIYRDELVIFDPSITPARGGDIVLVEINKQGIVAQLETDLNGNRYLRRFSENEKQTMPENTHILGVAIEIKSRLHSNESLAARKIQAA